MHLCNCYLLLLVAVSGQLVEVLGAAPSIELADKSYKITANLFVSESGTQNFLYELHEYHSAWQKRSRLSYRTISKENEDGSTGMFPDRATFYSDEDQIFVRDEESGKCRHATNEFADKLFNLNQLKSMERSFLIGASRLLQFASTNTLNLHATSTIREMDRFDYIIPGTNTIYELYYFKEAGQNFPFGIPVALIMVVDQNKDYLLTYEFKRVDVLPNHPLFGPSGSLAGQTDGQTEQVSLEWMTIEPQSGCDHVLRAISGTQTNVFAQDLRFSFEARSGDLSTFVGYEPAIKSLRVNRVSPTRITETMTNFHTALTYHVIKRRQEQDYILDKLVEVHKNKELDGNSVCVATKAAITDQRAQSFKLAAMLFGSSQLSYLGVAQVRGIEARAYLAYDSEWPLWYQQPIEYYTTTDWISVSKTTETRPPLDNDSNHIIVTIIYLTHTDKVEDQFTGKPLMMEFHSVHKETSQRIATRTYQIYDFSWHLNSEQFFSLADSCSSPSSEDNHYGQIDLLLQNELATSENETAVGQWLGQTRKRNFAIMKAIQENAGLPASIVYDIESRYKISSATSDLQTGPRRLLSVGASMRLVEHVRSLVQLIFIGRGGLEPGQWKNFHNFKAVSFQSCYFIASHREVGLLFAFDPARMDCFIYNKIPVIGNAKLTIQENFKIYSSGYLEVYRIRHVKSSKRDDSFSMLGKTNWLMARMSKLFLVDPTDSDKQVYVDLKSVESSELNEKSATEVDELGFADSNKFLGFGLVPDDKHSRQIEPKHLAGIEQVPKLSEKFGHMFTAMTFGQCQAACMSDFDCEAFSVCVKDAQIECILSKISFRSEALVLQILQSLDGQAKLNAEYELFLEDGAGKVKVRRHPGCELHNKLYNDFFTKSGKDMRVNLLQRFLRPVTHREDCAKMCMGATLPYTFWQASWQALNEPEIDPLSVRRLFREYKLKNMHACAAFYYLEQSDFVTFGQTKQKMLERQMVGRNENGTTYGYCILGASLTDAERKAWKEANDGQEPDSHTSLDVTVSRHNFDFSALFEQQHGVSLAGSKMDAPLSAVYSQLVVPSATHAITREQFEAIKLFVQRGENIVHQLIFEDAAGCARLCFQQQVQMWPGCRSFDVIEIDIYTFRQIHCFFNSISVSDALKAERFDLIREKASDQEHLRETSLWGKITKVTHYEPRNDFVANSLTLAGQLTMDETFVEQVVAPLKAGLRLGGFGLFVTIVVALAFGVLSGVILGIRVIIPRMQHQPDDVEALVERPTIGFNNLVNYEGNIPEPDNRRTSGDQPEEQLEQSD